jgi:AcrR family transcriptional regulator
VPRIGRDARDARRRHIVDAARACLDRDGPDGVTARAVVAEAGISTGALYHHFPSLEALRAELVERELVAGIGAVAARAPSDEDPLSWAIGALVCSAPVGVAAPTGEAGEGSERVVRATLAEVVRAADAVGSLRPDLDHEALVELLALLWEAIDRRADVAARPSGDRLAATLTDLLAAGVRPPPRG